MFEEYLISHFKTYLLEIIQGTDDKKHYAININFLDLFENDPSLGKEILKNAEIGLKKLDHLILEALNKVPKELEANVTSKFNIHARVYGLPACPELHRNIFPKNQDVDQFLQITGIVVRVTATKMLEHQRRYMCTKCKYIDMVEAIYELKHVIQPPKKCINPSRCPGKNLISTEDLDVQNCKDYQEIKIQEQSSKLGVGSMPSSMWVTLEDDLVDSCKPGDEVTICGIVKRRWGPLVSGKIIEVELVIKANHIQVNNNQISPTLITPEIKNQFASFWETYKNKPLEGRNIILKSFCAKLFGMYIVKLALAVVLAGGSSDNQGNEIGIQKRSESHILLVGDPGTGKSQLLRYAAKVVPRSVLTTGIGTTSAGLTVAALMEDGQWQLEGGALVLADGGICCIDEFNSMKSHDRTCIHEAMEQQTISVAKASIVCKLRTRCSIIAATNPKGGHLDMHQPLSLNLTLPSPLLSRFDVVLMIKDNNDDKWDDVVADYILSGKGVNAIKMDSSLWTLEMLQQYFMLIKNINPVLTPSANKILSCYYQAQRHSLLRNKAMTTVRLLDSLVRLSQGHARLMSHTEVLIMDAIFAVLLIENSMHGECAVLSLDPINVQTSFLSNPMENYKDLVVSILTKLGLTEILRNELSLLNSGYKYKNELLLSSITNNEETLNNRSQSTNDRNKFQSDSNIEEELQNRSILEDENIENNINQSSKNENVKGKKRKKSNCVEKNCKDSKSPKNIVLNEMGLLKQIPSINDAFNLEICELSKNDENNISSISFNQTSNNNRDIECSQIKSISQIKKRFSFKPRNLPHLHENEHDMVDKRSKMDKKCDKFTDQEIKNDNVSKDMKKQENVDSTSFENKTFENISSNSNAIANNHRLKLRNNLEPFKWHNQFRNECLNPVKPDEKNDAQNLFKSQVDDDDCLDIDF